MQATDATRQCSTVGMARKRGRRRQAALTEQGSGLDRVFVWHLDGALVRSDILPSTRKNVDPLESSSVLCSVTSKLDTLTKRLYDITKEFCEEQLFLKEFENTDQMHIDDAPSIDDTNTNTITNTNTNNNVNVNTNTNTNVNTSTNSSANPNPNTNVNTNVNTNTNTKTNTPRNVESTDIQDSQNNHHQGDLIEMSAVNPSLQSISDEYASNMHHDSTYQFASHNHPTHLSYNYQTFSNHDRHHISANNSTLYTIPVSTDALIDDSKLSLYDASNAANHHHSYDTFGIQTPLSYSQPLTSQMIQVQPNAHSTLSNHHNDLSDLPSTNYTGSQYNHHRSHQYQLHHQFVNHYHQISPHMTASNNNNHPEQQNYNSQPFDNQSQIRDQHHLDLTSSANQSPLYTHQMNNSNIGRDSKNSLYNLTTRSVDQSDIQDERQSVMSYSTSYCAESNNNNKQRQQVPSDLSASIAIKSSSDPSNNVARTIEPAGIQDSQNNHHHGDLIEMSAVNPSLQSISDEYASNMHHDPTYQFASHNHPTHLSYNYQTFSNHDRHHISANNSTLYTIPVSTDALIEDSKLSLYDASIAASHHHSYDTFGIQTPLSYSQPLTSQMIQLNQAQPSAHSALANHHNDLSDLPAINATGTYSTLSQYNHHRSHQYQLHHQFVNHYHQISPHMTASNNNNHPEQQNYNSQPFDNQSQMIDHQLDLTGSANHSPLYTHQMNNSNIGRDSKNSLYNLTTRSIDQSDIQDERQSVMSYSTSYCAESNNNNKQRQQVPSDLSASIAIKSSSDPSNNGDSNCRKTNNLDKFNGGDTNSAISINNIRTVINNQRNWSAKLSIRYQKIKSIYNLYRGKFNVGTQTRIGNELGDIISEIDHYTLDWRKSAIDCLRLISESSNCTNVVVTNLPLVVAFGQLVCLGLADYFDVDQVYSANKNGKEACIKRIRKKFGSANKCTYVVIGEKEDVELAHNLNLPFWRTTKSDGHQQLRQLYKALSDGLLL